MTYKRMQNDPWHENGHVQAEKLPACRKQYVKPRDMPYACNVKCTMVTCRRMLRFLRTCKRYVCKNTNFLWSITSDAKRNRIESLYFRWTAFKFQVVLLLANLSGARKGKEPEDFEALQFLSSTSNGIGNKGAPSITGFSRLPFDVSFSDA